MHSGIAPPKDGHVEYTMFLFTVFYIYIYALNVPVSVTQDTKTLRLVSQVLFFHNKHCTVSIGQQFLETSFVLAKKVYEIYHSRRLTLGYGGQG